MAITNKTQAVNALQQNIEWYNNQDAAFGGNSPFAAVRDSLQLKLDTLIARPDTIGFADIEESIGQARQSILSGRFKTDMRRLAWIAGTIGIAVVLGIVAYKVIRHKPLKTSKVK